MKRYICSVIILAFVANASEFVLQERSEKIQKTFKKIIRKRSKNVNFEFIEIKENNTTKSIPVSIEDVNSSGISRESTLDNKLNSKDGLLITLIDKNINIEAFENRFRVKLKEKLRIGYYIFENNSALNDIALMNSILNSNDGQNIETIKPNWKIKMKKY